MSDQWDGRGLPPVAAERVRRAADGGPWTSMLTVPSAAVQLGPNGPFTYVVKNDSTVEVRPLELGAESGGLTVIKKGITLNERVVTSNQYRLQAGVHVRDNAAAPKAS